MAKKQSKKEEQLQAQVIALRAEGATYSDIAQQTGLGVQEAIDIASSEVYHLQTLQAVRMEAMLSSQQVDNRGRVEQLSNIRARLRAELDRRDLSDLPTDKLISLLIKINDTLKGEIVTPQILSTSQQKKNVMWDW